MNLPLSVIECELFVFSLGCSASMLAFELSVFAGSILIFCDIVPFWFTCVQLRVQRRMSGGCTRLNASNYNGVKNWQ